MNARVLEENGVVWKQGQGWMWAQTYQGGHTQPHSQPIVIYRHLEWALERVREL